MVGRLRVGLSRSRGVLIGAVASLASGLAAFAVGHAAPETISLLKVRMGGDSFETRMVIELDGSASGKVVADGSADRRVVVLLPGVTAAQVQQAAGRGVVRAW